jgi:hypothetical protein
MGIVGSQLAVVAGEFIPSDSFELLDSQVKYAYVLFSVFWNRNRNCNFLPSGTGTGMHSGSGVHHFRLLGLPSGHEHYSVNNTFFALGKQKYLFFFRVKSGKPAATSYRRSEAKPAPLFYRPAL